MTGMYTGKIIRFFEHRRLMAAVCLGQDGERLRLLCADGSRSCSVYSTHCSCITGGSGRCSAPRKAFLSTCATTWQSRQRWLSKSTRCRLWETVAAPGDFCEIPALARAAFGDTATSVHEAAVLAALVEDHVYFKLHGRVFLAHTAAAGSGSAAEKSP